jgi:radical S-adenosyl methionine domain-containing protein 2
MFLQPCNFRCSYCFAVFNDLKGQYLTQQENLQLCQLLSQKFNKMTFLGGEPTLVPYLPQLLQIAKNAGCTTSIITNGSRLTDEKYVKSLSGLLDWVTISIDSASPEVHAALGRGYGPRPSSSSTTSTTIDPTNTSTNTTLSPVTPLTNEHYLLAASLIKKYKMKLKISTVINQLNKDEDMTLLITALQPMRWKLFQCLYIEGENSNRVEPLLVSKEEMESFIARHEHLTLPETISISNSSTHSGDDDNTPTPTVVITRPAIAIYSSNEDTKGGYACITPAGCFLDDVDNTHRYSRPILSVGVEEAWSDIDYRPENFRARGGYYQWGDYIATNTNSGGCGQNVGQDIEDLLGREAKRASATTNTKMMKMRTVEVGSCCCHPVTVSSSSPSSFRCPKAELSSSLNMVLSVFVGTVFGVVMLRSFAQ